jgi:hypothetical protein
VWKGGGDQTGEGMAVNSNYILSHEWYELDLRWDTLKERQIPRGELGTQHVTA